MFDADQWVSKFEREYDLCYRDSVSRDSGLLETEDVEAMFEELHRQTEAEQHMEYASRQGQYFAYCARTIICILC